MEVLVACNFVKCNFHSDFWFHVFSFLDKRSSSYFKFLHDYLHKKYLQTTYLYEIEEIKIK